MDGGTSSVRQPICKRRTVSWATAMPNYQRLYERQYGEGKLVCHNALPRLRSFFHQYDLTRNDLAPKYLTPGQTFLDLGCGEGTGYFALSDRYQRIIGIDIAPSRLALAKKKVDSQFSDLKHKFLFLQHNLDETLPLKSESVDAINCVAVIEHVFEVFDLVKECYRVLKPCGEIVAEVPNIAYLRHRLKILVGVLPATSSPTNWPQIGWDGGHIHYFTMKEFCELFEWAGFRIRLKTGTGLLAGMRNWWPSLLCGDCAIVAQKPK